ncbi:hypothetical protein DY000_02020913 [Brassica cretica]|uniref:Uncharacterized protein n=1 Tax=Brassica cretica TaxID=69181 RepID=A0ABQ7E886_BRACR|nr:hypothetical protein DY000_02020913 [Brassica cretica]
MRDKKCARRHKIESMPSLGMIIAIMTGVADRAGGTTSCNSVSYLGAGRQWFTCIPSSTRSNKDKHLLFSEDPAHLERSIRKDQRSTSINASAFTSTNSRTQPSTDTRLSSSTDLHHSPSIDTTPHTSIDPQSRSMVAIVILRQDENGNMYDQDVICVMQHVRN